VNSILPCIKLREKVRDSLEWDELFKDLFLRYIELWADMSSVFLRGWTVLSCISNLVLCDIQLLLYLFPRNLKKKGCLDLDPFIPCSLLWCAWRCAYDKGCYCIKGII
jgi:hypothetical protein